MELLYGHIFLLLLPTVPSYIYVTYEREALYIMYSFLLFFQFETSFPNSLCEELNFNEKNTSVHFMEQTFDTQTKP